jgi:hypothetical protein
LIRIKLLRTTAELRALELPQQESQAIILRQRLVALGNGGITLGAYRPKQSAERIKVGGRLSRKFAHVRH